MSTDKFKMVGKKAVIDKDPNAILDYTVDFSRLLDPFGDTILSAQVLVTGGLTEVSADRVVGTKTVRIWLSGGTLTVDGEYASATVRITSANNPNRVDDRTVFFNIIER